MDRQITAFKALGATDREIITDSAIYEKYSNRVARYDKLYTYHPEENSLIIETIDDKGNTTAEEEYPYDSDGREIYRKENRPML